MYLIDDEGFIKLFNGEFYQVVLVKKKYPNISIKQLYNYQFKYNSYVGFLKFYRKHLEPIIDNIRLVDNNSIKGKIIRFITNEKNK